MASPLNLEVGLSESTSQATRSGGDFVVTGGGAKQSQTLFIVVGIVIVAVAFAVVSVLRK